tara:strand:+ start:944 stop:1438 length:495 start_codon:yes stop_codon:yes gene_type:complete
LNLSTVPIRKLIASAFCLVPFAITGCSASSTSEIKSKSPVEKVANERVVEVANQLELAATKQEINLYRRIGTNYICIARQAEIEFPKALAIAATNFAALIDNKHGGFIEELGDKKLTRKQIYNGSQIQLLEGAIRACPERVPEEDKSKFKEFLETLKSNREKSK